MIKKVKEMVKNKVIISYSGRNYGAHLPDLPGCVSVGDTLEEMKKNITEAAEGHIEVSLKDGDPIADSFKKEFELVYELTPAAALQAVKELVPLSGISRISKINQRQLQHYASGLKSPRPAQIRKIENALHEIGRKLLAVKLYN